jgi:hypothetical protein
MTPPRAAGHYQVVNGRNRIGKTWFLVILLSFRDEGKKNFGHPQWIGRERTKIRPPLQQTSKLPADSPPFSRRDCSFGPMTDCFLRRRMVAIVVTRRRREYFTAAWPVIEDMWLEQSTTKAYLTVGGIVFAQIEKGSAMTTRAGTRPKVVRSDAEWRQKLTPEQ